MNPKGLFDILTSHIDGADERLQALLAENIKLKKQYKKLCQIIELSDAEWCNNCGRTKQDPREMFFKCCICHKVGCVYCCSDIFHCFKCQSHSHTACISLDGSHVCGYDGTDKMDEFEFWDHERDMHLPPIGCSTGNHCNVADHVHLSPTGCSTCESGNFTGHVMGDGIPPVCNRCAESTVVNLSPKLGQYPTNYYN